MIILRVVVMDAAKDQEHFTLMLNSFHRLDLMKASIAHYARCPIVNEIRVVRMLLSIVCECIPQIVVEGKD